MSLNRILYLSSFTTNLLSIWFRLKHFYSVNSVLRHYKFQNFAFLDVVTLVSFSTLVTLNIKFHNFNLPVKSIYLCIKCRFSRGISCTDRIVCGQVWQDCVLCKICDLLAQGTTCLSPETCPHSLEIITLKCLKIENEF